MRDQNNRLRKKVNEIITKETTFFWLKNNIYYILTHTKKDVNHNHGLEPGTPRSLAQFFTTELFERFENSTDVLKSICTHKLRN